MPSFQDIPPIMFPGSSAVEQLTVNQLVAGSNPARGAIFLFLQFTLSFQQYTIMRSGLLSYIGWRGV